MLLRSLLDSEANTPRTPKCKLYHIMVWEQLWATPRRNFFNTHDIYLPRPNPGAPGGWNPGGGWNAGGAPPKPCGGKPPGNPGGGPKLQRLDIVLYSLWEKSNIPPLPANGGAPAKPGSPGGAPLIPAAGPCKLVSCSQFIGHM